MPGPRRAERPLSRPFVGVANIAVLYRTDGWSQQGTLLQKVLKIECEVILEVKHCLKSDYC